MKKKLPLLLSTPALFCCFALFLLGPQCTPITEIPLLENDLLVSMKKGACFGRCPVFEINVYNNGIASFQGERYTPKLGLWVRKLTEAEMKGLRKQLAASNIWQFPEFYRSRLTDLPQITITQYEDGAKKQIAGKETRPPEVIALENVLDGIASASGWTIKKPFDYGLPAGVIPNQLLVELRPGVYPQQWLLKYRKQEMEILRTLEDKSNYYLVQYDPTITLPKQMQQLLYSDQQIASFEFNKESKN